MVVLQIHRGRGERKNHLLPTIRGREHVQIRYSEHPGNGGTGKTGNRVNRLPEQSDRKLLDERRVTRNSLFYTPGNSDCH